MKTVLGSRYILITFILRSKNLKDVRIAKEMLRIIFFNFLDVLRRKVTKLNNGVRGQKNTPPEYSIFWENVSVFSLCVIINPSFSRRHEIGMVLAFLTLSNSRLKLHIFGNYLQTNWSIEMIFTPKCLFRQVLLISASLILQIRPRNVWSPKSVNLDICKICTFFAFEVKLLEIEVEDTIRFLYYVQVFSIRKRFVKEKI